MSLHLVTADLTGMAAGPNEHRAACGARRRPVRLDNQDARDRAFAANGLDDALQPIHIQCVGSLAKPRPRPEVQP